MRILMTTDTLGGVWTFTKELSRELLENGCAIAMVSLGRIPSPAQLDWVAEQVSVWGANFRFAASDAPLEWMHDNWGAMSEGERLVRRVASEFGAELLLSSQFCFGAMDGDFSRIVVAHSDVLSWAQACRGGVLPASDWLDRYKSLVEDGLRGADAVVAPTQWMLDALGENFELPREAHVISNGRTFRESAPGCERAMQAATAGRLWDEGKNLKLLGEVDSPVPVLVAGEAEHEFSHLEHGCGQAKLLGSLDEEKLLTLFRRSSIYVCTSVYEPFGLAPLEAALCGCAVLLNDLASLREVWGDTVLYFNDAASLSALLNALAQDARLLARARNRTRRRAFQLTARKMAKGYLELFQTIVQPAVAEHYVA